MEKKIIGRCPLCGGNVVKTCKGYRCENNIAEQPTCVLNINGIIGNRKMSDEEIAELLEHRFILLDGFASKDGKAFPSVLELADKGWKEACKEDKTLYPGLNIIEGQIVYPAVAEAFGLPCYPAVL